MDIPKGLTPQDAALALHDAAVLAVPLQVDSESDAAAELRQPGGAAASESASESESESSEHALRADEPETSPPSPARQETAPASQKPQTDQIAQRDGHADAEGHGSGGLAGGHDSARESPLAPASASVPAEGDGGTAGRGAGDSGRGDASAASMQPGSAASAAGKKRRLNQAQRLADGLSRHEQLDSTGNSRRRRTLAAT